jgi:Ni,Fe-hydrogenase maturation factor
MKELKTDPKMLLVGIGNYDWGDDSIGWSFVDRLISQGYDFLDYQYRYKLKTEDAELISKYDVVVFVSASQEKINQGYELSSCIAASHAFYSEDVQAPSAILHLTTQLYKRNPKAYFLRISGMDWRMQPYLSREANKNMEAAVAFFDEEFLPSILTLAV